MTITPTFILIQNMLYHACKRCLGMKNRTSSRMEHLPIIIATYPPRSPDLTPMDFFMRGHVKHKVYTTKPATINELRAAIERECADIPIELIRNVLDSISERC